MEKLRIVVADDHSIVRMGVREVVQGDPRFSIVGMAANSSELVRLYGELAPDIVIADYNMPGDEQYGDGLKLVGYLLRQFPGTRVLIYTMLSNNLIFSSLYDLGVAGVVPKSSDPEEILAALDAIAGGRIYRGACMQDPNSVLPGGDDIEGRIASLSTKEYEVLRHFVSGLSVRDIARVLNRSVKTVSAQKIAAMRKLEVDSDQALLTFCIKAELFQ
ncbi:two-component system, NarL family, captular synthesis response regulator RcsB [Pseudomonas citronellolis]|jgi:two-component system capsular synthesis response regulator RcsB|uniref:Two-component system, NarL family, captular synthesis response regulator RcsB n=1 Tax=Pseudomonas citronellolis TaxID=53408 RepID=A0AAQ1KHY9_9PSED|nr:MULTISPECIES: response regulator transcription factor [Pseudomonas]AMO74756.1 Transcriptional regulatory protein RcsB [Pseudomonas citronellolis]KES21450.1 LuxR family transcriptional regulator [Pseudomonas sp. AAC]KRV66803.1 LuxR family transcriptional regulator [Pseudomonas citronellolis]KRW75944.1 LuxR family transcriptional regulator [Pseudomonas citronellolis]KWR79119.1 LuxR family transcriptional regulator [Pseudomonas sp. PI1]